MPNIPHPDARSTSVPIPQRWTKLKDDAGQLHYVSGEYLITRVKTGRYFSFALFRSGIPTPPSIGRGRLRDAQAHAKRNAREQGEINIAQ